MRKRYRHITLCIILLLSLTGTKDRFTFSESVLSFDAIPGIGGGISPETAPIQLEFATVPAGTMPETTSPPEPETLFSPTDSETRTESSEPPQPSESPQPPPSLEPLAIPEVDVSFFAWMDYRKITNRTSRQWALQQLAYTGECGIRMIGDDYMVAMGTFYSAHAGERFRITLDSGSVFTVITGDIKSDRNTDSTNRYHIVGSSRANLLEFIIDRNAVDPMVIRHGTVGYYDKFRGDIIRIEYIGSSEYV